MIIELAVSIGMAVILAYYVRDVTGKVLARHFELKEELGELESKVNSLRNEVESSLRKAGSSGEYSKIREELLGEIKGIEQKITELGKLTKELQKLETKVNYETGSLRNDLERAMRRIESIETKLDSAKESLKEDIKRELLIELEEEIEHFEESIERRKDEEVQEFLEIIKAAVTLPPEKLTSGLMEAKKALLSLRDVAKVYVLTGKGQKEFRELKGNLVELLKSLRKLAIVSLPEEEVYSTFNDIIVKVKRLDMPMRVSRDGKEKELNPEKSFIQIHKLIFELAGELDEIAERLEEPIPVTPVEKEFYERLRHQFEELRKLEEQVHRLMLRLGENVTDGKEDRKVEEILKELDLL